MDAVEPDVLAHMAFPAEHRTRIASTNPLERLSREIKRRHRVCRLFTAQVSFSNPHYSPVRSALTRPQLWHTFGP